MTWVVFKIRFKQCWRHLWRGDLLMDDATRARWAKIQALVDSDLGSATRLAVAKGAKDRGVKVSPDDAKRKEAQEWAGVYLNDRAVPPDQRWATNFLIEWWVGVLTGKL